MDQGSTDPIESLTEQIKKLQDMVATDHVILLGIQRRARVMLLASILKWVVIIGISLGSFYFLQPFLENAFGAYRNFSVDGLQGLIK